MGVLSREELALAHPLLVEPDSPNAELRTLRVVECNMDPLVNREGNPLDLKLTELRDWASGGGDGGGGWTKNGCTLSSLPLSLGNVHTGKMLVYGTDGREEDPDEFEEMAPLVVVDELVSGSSKSAWSSKLTFSCFDWSAKQCTQSNVRNISTFLVLVAPELVLNTGSEYMADVLGADWSSSRGGFSGGTGSRDFSNADTWVVGVLDDEAVADAGGDCCGNNCFWCGGSCCDSIWMSSWEWLLMWDAGNVDMLVGEGGVEEDDDDEDEQEDEDEEDDDDDDDDEHDDDVGLAGSCGKEVGLDDKVEVGNTVANVATSAVVVVIVVTGGLNWNGGVGGSVDWNEEESADCEVCGSVDINVASVGWLRKRSFISKVPDGEDRMVVDDWEWIDWDCEQVVQQPEEHIEKFEHTEATEAEVLCDADKLLLFSRSETTDKVFWRISALIPVAHELGVPDPLPVMTWLTALPCPLVYKLSLP